MAEKYDYLVVGAGFAGSVLAERLAEDSGKSVLVVDRRGHIAGNAYDYVDSAGILIHAYGPHYFRTNSTKVVDYLSRFTKWHQVSYQVLVWTDGKYWQFPINLNTFEQYLGRPSTTEEMESTLAKWRENFPNPKTPRRWFFPKLVEISTRCFSGTTLANSGKGILEIWMHRFVEGFQSEPIGIIGL